MFFWQDNNTSQRKLRRNPIQSRKKALIELEKAHLATVVHPPRVWPTETHRATPTSHLWNENSWSGSKLLFLAWGRMADTIQNIVTISHNIARILSQYHTILPKYSYNITQYCQNIVTISHNIASVLILPFWLEASCQHTQYCQMSVSASSGFFQHCC